MSSFLIILCAKQRLIQSQSLPNIINNVERWIRVPDNPKKNANYNYFNSAEFLYLGLLCSQK